jgi:hypothetical protein
MSSTAVVPSKTKDSILLFTLRHPTVSENNVGSLFVFLLLFSSPPSLVAA